MIIYTIYVYVWYNLHLRGGTSAGKRLPVCIAKVIIWLWHDKNLNKDFIKIFLVALLSRPLNTYPLKILKLYISNEFFSRKALKLLFPKYALITNHYCIHIIIYKYFLYNI